ncbi:hypothetical protein ABPG72_004073 [Tetrahymena utriculariae]
MISNTQETFQPKTLLTPNLQMGLTFNDVLMVPQYSDINSRSECIVKTKFSKNIPLNIPIVSSPMDTVTEFKMAKEMAKCGGLGIIHRFMPITEQCKQVEKVKRAQAHILFEPIMVSKHSTYKEIKLVAEQYTFQTFLVTNEDQIINQEDFLKSPILSKKKDDFNGQYTLAGLLTRRDIKNMRFDTDKVADFMTPREKLVAHVMNNPDEGQFPEPEFLKQLMHSKRIEKIPIVTPDNKILALVTLKDLYRLDGFPIANRDGEGKLYVGAAIGAKDDYIERAKSLIEAGADVLVVDIANGHSQICIDAIKKLKENFEDIDIVAGSVATGQGAELLIKAGADGIRCGIGNGSICITRIVSGCGVPQFSALSDVAPICKQYQVPLISDGGNKNSGNMCKALAIGADCVMLGRLVGGCEESPSKIIYRDGKLQKVYRGMAGYGANLSKAQRIGAEEPSSTNFTPEGVEGYIPYAGPLAGVLNQFVQGIKSGMSYNGAHTIQELQKKVQFIRMTQSGFQESGVHSINQFN